MREALNGSRSNDVPSSTERWSDVAPITRLLMVMGIVWVLTGTILGGFSTFQFLDPYRVGRLILQGFIPYRDFPHEYPPGGAAILTFPAVFGRDAYEIVFRILMAGLWTTLLALVWRLDRPAVGPFLIASASLAWVIGGGFDIAVALTVYAAFNAARRNRSAGAATALGLGIAVKLTPGVLLPFALRASPRERLVRATTIAGFAILVSVVLPFVIARADGDPIRFHGDRSLHAESTIGSAIVLARIVTDRPYPVVIEDNARAVADAGATPGLIALGLMAVTLAFLWARGDPSSPATWAAALLAIPALGPLASPQFMLWPLALIASTSRRALVAFLIAAVLSGAMFSGPFEPSEGTALAVLTGLRNVALLATLAVTGASAARARSSNQARVTR